MGEGTECAKMGRPSEGTFEKEQGQRACARAACEGEVRGDEGQDLMRLLQDKVSHWILF